jgi:addiction module HigA family antidote
MIARKKTDRMPPIHPGEFLREDFLKPLRLSVNGLALALRVPATRITEIVHERRGITIDTALRLSIYFGTSPEYWQRMQAAYDLAMGETELMPRLKREVQRRVA